MATLALDTIYEPINSPSLGGGTLEVEDFDVDVFESNSDTEPENSAAMTQTDTITAGSVVEYNKPAKWILFESAGAAIIKENGLIKPK